MSQDITIQDAATAFKEMDEAEVTHTLVPGVTKAVIKVYQEKWAVKKSIYCDSYRCSMMSAVRISQVTTVIPSDRIPRVTHSSTQVGR